MSDKEKKFEIISDSVLRILAIHGEGGLKIARIAKSSNVSRAWIYKYIGRRQSSLVELAANRFNKILSPSLRDNWNAPQNKEAWVASSLRATRHFFKISGQHPYIITLYYRYRGTNTYYGELIHRYENQYHQAFCKHTQRSLKIERQRALFYAQTYTAMRFGLAHQLQTSSLEYNSSIEQLINLLEAILTKMTKIK